MKAKQCAAQRTAGAIASVAAMFALFSCLMLPSGPVEQVSGRAELHVAVKELFSQKCESWSDRDPIRGRAGTFAPMFVRASNAGNKPAGLYVAVFQWTGVLVPPGVDPLKNEDEEAAARWKGLASEAAAKCVPEVLRMARRGDGDACLALSVERTYGLVSRANKNEAMRWAAAAMDNKAPGARAWWEK
ncbi:hypothetical protein HZA57_02200, partial [Candidatus Poribacteria bacterium]|nr:hypothetical protein [Candidatus Poribacteria bacterium]